MNRLIALAALLAATPALAVPTPVTVRVAVEGDTARLIVADQGPGLSAEQQVRVFEKFEHMTRRMAPGVRKYSPMRPGTNCTASTFTP